MKKSVLLILFVGILFVGLSGVVSALTTISDCTDLQNMKNNLGEDYELTQDIDCSATSGWNSGAGFESIGCDGTTNCGPRPGNTEFTGSFDGKGFEISGLYINRPAESYIGFIGAADTGAEIKNVGVTGVDMEGRSSVGALVGRSLAVVSNSYSTGTVIGGASGYTGGLVGQQGIGADIFNSYSDVDVSGIQNIGGLVGISNADITDSYATGDVQASFATGIIGGLAGRLASNGNIYNSYSTGTVTADEDLGGLVGWNQGNIYNSYSTGTVSGTTADGGLVGRYGAVNCSNSFWDTQTSGLASSICGTGKTTSDMLLQSTFTSAGWDFGSTWKIEAGTYPCLQWQASCSGPIVSSLCSDSSQTIMKLYQSSNSHGALWDDTNYGYDICYDEIFSSAYSGANPHDCIGTNRVLSLSSVSNAHASEVNDADYSVDVCFGNLECEYDTSGGSSCLNGGEIVARAYSGTNSHVAVAGDGNYTFKICCGGTELYWADTSGVPITTEKPNIGDTIQAVATGMGAGTFNIKEYSGGNEDILSIVGDSVDGNLIGLWKIEKAHLDLAGGINSIDRFLFDVNGGSDDSNEIAVNATYGDSPMNVTIVSPECGNYSDMGTTITIDVSAIDEDDYINGTVEVNGVEIGTFKNGGDAFDHPFVLPGNYQIVAEAVNSRGKRARHISNIMILATPYSSNNGEKYVAACISEPKDYSDISVSNVNFSAVTTRAIEIVSNAPVVMNPGDSDAISRRFSWFWRFIAPNQQIDDIIYEFANTTDSLAYRFQVEFSVAGDNSASLRVEFD